MQSAEYWFEPKYLGWGFMPTTLEGWIATICLLTMIFISAYLNDMLKMQKGFNFRLYFTKNGLRFLFETIIVTSVFTALFADKVEGGLQWRLF